MSVATFTTDTSDRRVGGRARVFLPWAVAVASAVLASATIGLTVANWDHPEVRSAFYLQDLGVAIVFPPLGAVILSRRPGHLIGWIFLGTALLALAGFTSAYALYGLVLAPGSVPAIGWAAWVSSWSWTPFLTLPTLLVLLFPTGRPPSSRWRPVAYLVAGWILGVTLLGALLPGTFTDHAGVENPLGVAFLEPLVGLADLLIGVVVIGFAPLCLLALVLRFRRSQGEERAQLKWFVAGAGAAFTAFIASAFLPTLAADAVWLVGLACLPLAATIAITRYRLYDIDLVINRALVYGTLSVSGVAMYVLVVTLLGTALAGWAPTLIATGLIAVAFEPLRARAQSAADRMLYGQRSDPYAALAGLGTRLESRLPVDAVLPVVIEAIAAALKVPYVAIATVEDVPDMTARRGTPVAEPVRLPMLYRGERVGELVVSPRAPGGGFSSSEHRLIEDFARQAAATVQAVRLTEDLIHSRQSIVTGREEERRRLRRDLHDGLGPTLAGLTLQVDAARRMVDGAPAEANARLEQVKDDLQTVVSEIRRLVYALRPVTLDEFGLVGALRQYAERMTHGQRRAMGRGWRSRSMRRTPSRGSRRQSRWRLTAS